jgi:hypothetical protein
VPLSGWPISLADLEPYYRQAIPIVRIGPYVFDEKAWSLFEMNPPPFLPEKIKHHFWQGSTGPVRFGEAYGEELKNSENITVLLNANVTSLHTDKHGQAVTHLNVATLQGRIGRIKAKRFVLACGAIENPRLLLLSNQTNSKGLGNEHDLVGRFFMEHPNTRCGIVVGADEGSLLNIFQKRFFEGISFRHAMEISEEVQEQEQCLAVAASFDPEEEMYPGVEAARQLARSLSDLEVPQNITGHIRTIMSDLDQIADYSLCRLKGHTRCSTQIQFYVRMEQAPNPNSRVTLSSKRDALGLNRVNLDWRLTDMERQTARTMMTSLGSEFGRLKYGRVQLADWLEKGQDPEWKGSYHQMGTTRMADDPKMGVVNKDCRVHGISNLYVAGSSVFPTSGFVTPTFTIVALALRLAKHLKEQAS